MGGHPRHQTCPVCKLLMPMCICTIGPRLTYVPDAERRRVPPPSQASLDDIARAKAQLRAEAPARVAPRNPNPARKAVRHG